MQAFFRGVLAAALFGVLLLAQPSNAETSDDFNTVDMFFYGDLDNADGNVSTIRPTSNEDTQSDCPQDSNRKSFFGNDRQWGDVGVYIVYFDTPGEIESGTYTFRIWANATQGDVDDVQFRIGLDICGSNGCSTLVDDVESNEDGVDSQDDMATEFEIEFELSNSSQRSFEEGERLEIELEYSGGEDGEEPIIGGESTDQIVVLTSSVGHPAGIGNLSINHYRVEFTEIIVEEFSERVFVKATVESAFGKADIDSSEWTLGVYGKSSGNQGLTADFNMKSSQNDTYQVSFYWYYNKDNAISDTYNFYLQIIDIQDNSWEVVSDEDLYLVIHGFEIDNYILPGDIRINNETGTSVVSAGSSFTLDITVSAQGDPLITYNPIPVSIVWVDGTSEIVLYETAVFATPGASAKISFRHTFDKEGDYQIKVVIDRGNVVYESDENNNVGEFTVQVSEPEKENAIQSFIDDITEGGTASTLTILVAVSLLSAFVYLRKSGEPDFEWEDDDEF